MTTTELIVKLKQIGSFKGSMPDQFFDTSYMKEKDVIEELYKRYKMFIKLKDFKGCGELTSHEKKELKLLEQFFNHELIKCPSKP